VGLHRRVSEAIILRQSLVREVEELISDHVQPDGLFVHTVAVRQKFKGTGLSGKLLRHVLPIDDRSPIFLLGPQASVLSFTDERTEWLDKITSLHENEEIQLFQIDGKKLVEVIKDYEE